jgi:hypothetical protein
MNFLSVHDDEAIVEPIQIGGDYVSNDDDDDTVMTGGMESFLSSNIESMQDEEDGNNSTVNESMRDEEDGNSVVDGMFGGLSYDGRDSVGLLSENENEDGEEYIDKASTQMVGGTSLNINDCVSLFYLKNEDVQNEDVQNVIQTLKNHINSDSFKVPDIHDDFKDYLLEKIDFIVANTGNVQNMGAEFVKLAVLTQIVLKTNAERGTSSIEGYYDCIDTLTVNMPENAEDFLQIYNDTDNDNAQRKMMTVTYASGRRQPTCERGMPNFSEIAFNPFAIFTF